jgi:F0F1-type ATP synthase delta subunit
MNKKLLKQLVLESYIKGELDQKKVMAIADRLTRKELKVYIKALKQTEKQRSVTIAIAGKATEEQQKQFQSMFPNKKVIVTYDPSLMTGVRISNNDDIFEMNLKHELDVIIQQVSE